MTESEGPPPREPEASGRSSDPPPPFNPDLDLIIYYDGEGRGIVPERSILHGLWRDGFWRDLWQRIRGSKSKT